MTSLSCQKEPVAGEIDGKMVEITSLYVWQRNCLARAAAGLTLSGSANGEKYNIAAQSTGEPF